MFEAVIFDWDGTLADTRQAVITSFQTILRQIECEVSDRFIERRIGIGTEETFKEALKDQDVPFNDKKIEKLAREKIDVQIQLTETVQLFEGAVDLLKSLENRTKMALASMSNRRVVEKLLTEKDLKRYFDFVITADDVLKPKPDPEIFVKCSQELKLHPGKLVVIEDSVFGIRSARNAGMRCIAVMTGAYSKEELRKERPDLIVDSVKENSKILKFILN